MSEYDPPKLRPLGPALAAIPASRHAWIAQNHLKYLDDRIHKIDELTDYLAACDPVAVERQEFIDFVEEWTRIADPDLQTYLREYSARFSSVRNRVEDLCDRALSDEQLWHSHDELLQFWQDFTYINEVDSLHGMFLTSGRWYVNVMLPAVKELIYATLPDELVDPERNELSYHVARRVITPRFAQVPTDYDYSHEQRFATLFMPLLQYYDRKLLFLFEVFARIPVDEIMTLDDLVQDVDSNPGKYAELLDTGIYPPFGWHELQASRRPRRPALDYQTATTRLLGTVKPAYSTRAQAALNALATFKEYELNYNNYNYKGRFGVISKYQFWRTAAPMTDEQRVRFLDAILLDRFYDALDVVMHSLA